MVFLHTSDLHLGKRLHEVSLLSEQRHILAEICRLAQEHRCQAVVVAGDIYDKSAPSAEAVALFDWFVTTLYRMGIPLIAIAGNHDSADRIGYASALLNQNGVYLSPRFDGTVDKAVLRDELGDVNFYLLPFLKPAVVAVASPEANPENEAWTYDKALRYAVGLTNADFGCRNVLIGHQYVTGGERAESEDVSVGGLDNISADIFDGFDYCALGHLHKPQSIGRETLRYSGSPLKYSLDEVSSEKSAVLVHLGEKGQCRTELLPLHPLHDVRQIRGSYADLTLLANYAGTATDDYLHVILTDENYIPDAMSRLRTIYPNILRLEYANIRTSHDADMDELSLFSKGRELSPFEMFEALYQAQNNAPLNEDGQAMVKGIFEKLEVADE